MPENHFDVQFTVWLDPKQPNRAHITSSDGRFTDEQGGSPGLRLVATSNPLSADYNPGVFNRVVRAAQSAGHTAAAESSTATEHPRHIDKRFGLIVNEYRAALRGLQTAKAAATFTGADLPAASDFVNPWVRKLVDTFPDLKRAEAVLVGLVARDGGTGVILADLRGGVIAFDGWYHDEVEPTSLVASLDDDEPFEAARILARQNLSYAPWSRAMAEGVTLTDYVERRVQFGSDDLQHVKYLTEAEPFTFTAVG